MGIAVYGFAILAFIGALWWFNHWRQTRLDADPGQQRLAELLVSAALGRGASEQQVRDQLAAISRGGADARVRLTHAVMLVRSEAAPELYEKVLALSRQI
ncbi:MAG TPA: hypothetical protein VFV30_04785 [Novosphingobium sp.]|nr:hypothetical protein [Novosphingobium sp.]